MDTWNCDRLKRSVIIHNANEVGCPLIDQLLECLGRAEANAEPTSSEEGMASMYNFGGRSVENTPVEMEHTSEVPAETVEDTRDDAPSEETTPVEESEEHKRYPQRAHKPPELYGH